MWIVKPEILCWILALRHGLRWCISQSFCFSDSSRHFSSKQWKESKLEPWDQQVSKSNNVHWTKYSKSELHKQYEKNISVTFQKRASFIFISTSQFPIANHTKPSQLSVPNLSQEYLVVKKFDISWCQFNTNPILPPSQHYNWTGNQW